MQIRIHIPSQTLDLLDGDTLLRRYVVSTSRFGLGSEPGSNRTPTGNFRIAEMHGGDAAQGEILVGRERTGRTGEEGDDHDHVQTRIIWLDGIEEENANTKERYIYIHGTNAESHLGTPASMGCVRMSNSDVADLFARVEPGMPVEIQP